MPFADEKGARFIADKGQSSVLKDCMVHDMSGKLINVKGEVRELMSKYFKNIKPAKGVLPKELLDVLPRTKSQRPVDSRPQ